MASHPSQAPNTSLALAESNTGRIPDVYKKKKENRQLRSIFLRWNLQTAPLRRCKIKSVTVFQISCKNTVSSLNSSQTTRAL